MRVLGLDISTSAGWAFKEDGRLVSFGHLGLDKTVHEYGLYPWSYLAASEDMSVFLMDKVRELDPDVIVIEETNLGKSRYSQKTLEFTHRALLAKLKEWAGITLNSGDTKVIYLSSSTWRQALGLVMSKEDKKNNAKLSKAKRAAAAAGIKLDKKTLGVKGKITKKHVALNYVNAAHGLKLKVKDNDAADAICLCDAYEKGALPCDGVM